MNTCFNQRCKVCSSKDLKGNPLRDRIDAMIATGNSNHAALKYLCSKGIFTSVSNFSRHLNNHSKASVMARKELRLRASLLRLNPGQIYERVLDLETKGIIERSKERDERITKANRKRLWAVAEAEFALISHAADRV